MSQVGTSERLGSALDHVWVAERALHANPEIPELLEQARADLMGVPAENPIHTVVD